MCVYASARKADDNWISRVRTGWFWIRRTARNYKTPRDSLGQGGAMIAWEYNPQSVQPWDVVAENTLPRVVIGKWRTISSLGFVYSVAWINHEKHVSVQTARRENTRLHDARIWRQTSFLTLQFSNRGIERWGRTNYSIDERYFTLLSTRMAV